jgi:hypothetical protein
MTCNCIYLTSALNVRLFSRWTLIAEDRIRALVSPCGIVSGQSGTGTSFGPSYLVFPSQYHSTVPSILICYLGNERKARWWQQFRDIVSQHRHDQHEHEHEQCETDTAYTYSVGGVCDIQHVNI